MDKSRLIKVGLIISVMINLILFESNYYHREAKLAHLEEVYNGINYSYEFGEILYEKFTDLTLDEKVGYLSSMHWSLTVSKWTLEDIQPNDRKYIDFISLLNIYIHIPTELEGMIRQNKNEDEVLILLETWLKDINDIKEKLSNNPLSKMNNKELEKFLKSLQLQYPSDSVELYKQLLDR